MRTRNQATNRPPAPAANPRRLPERASKIRGQASGTGATVPRAPRQGLRSSGRLTGSTAPGSSSNKTDDESLSEADSDVATPRSARVNHRKRAAPPESPDPLAPSSAIKRPRPSTGFYDQESDSDSEGSDIDADNEGDHTSNAYLSPNTDAERPTRASVDQKSRSPKQRGRGGLSSKRPGSTISKAEVETPTKSPEVIPDWASLPYYALVQIFRTAFASLDDRTGVNWLLDMSRVCRAFSEPALTALYECPPLLSRSMAHKLVDLIARDPETTAYKYRQKIEKLRFDVEHIIAKTYKGQHLNLKSLIGNLPRLSVVDFYHQKDAAPFRELDENLRWTYPSALFEALGYHDSASTSEGSPSPSALPCKLQGWRWNRRLLGQGQDFNFIERLHTTTSFKTLKKLSFVNYQLPSMTNNRLEDEEAAAQDRTCMENFARVITVLPALQFLSFESSTVVNGHFLSLLPSSLQSLAFINCWDVKADDFADYLLTRGSNLQHLTLHHNQSLSLAFVTILGTACPHLRSLSMDFKCYNHHEFYKDSDPAYEHVLTPSQIPVWPTGIESIELRNMRKWSLEAAGMLFQSLGDNAEDLTRLRHLELKAMLDVSFRQRSKFRDEWESKLKAIFLRKPTNPKQLRSLHAGNSSPEVVATVPPKKRKSQGAAEGPARRSGRLATQASRPSSRASSVGRGLRNGNSRPSYAEPDTDDEIHSDSEGGSSKEEEGSRLSSPTSNVITQGKCEIVIIQLDNQKPTETVWTMDNFLDSESDDPTDEDWNGDHDPEDGYAW
jgi:hypothetical protein